MSEEILKALAQLYAIITKQDSGVTERERNYVINTFRKKLDQDTLHEYLQLYDGIVGYGAAPVIEEQEPSKKKLTSVKDSVKTLAICKKINKTLSQKQKVIVLVELLEMVYSDKNYTTQRRQILDTVSEVFNIEPDEHKLIESFVLSESVDKLDHSNILLINNYKNQFATSATKCLHADSMEGNLIFIRVKSVDLYFAKYLGEDVLTINSLPMVNGDVMLFSHGSIIKSSLGASFFYSDIVSHFLSNFETVKLSFNVSDVTYHFPNKQIGLQNITVSEGPGRLIGIMGASGSGKTTLLNVLSGLNPPSSGKILINGIDIYKEREKIEGVIGYIAQDDLLIEELTVFDNLYYNATLCFKHKSKAEIIELVDKTLDQLGLLQIKELKVGSPLNKTISGGQRKRLNIALELIREPSVLFVDEPTSGLSSRDSENVIDLLKELSLRGKLIFVVIHQPSSDIYKMFDRMIILDQGGYQIYYGNPIEAISYFKHISGQADWNKGQCPACGTVNPETIFNVVEERVVDEFGNFTPKRKITPAQWHEHLKKPSLIPDVNQKPPSGLNIPGKLKQLLIFAIRDVKSKLSNRQYILINLLEAPVLAFILAFIVKYNNDASETNYLFRYNENIPAYILMSIVVALFMGLSVSAEEIIRDKKILKREAFLNLSRGSYLHSKLAILFTLSAIQTFTFVLIGNWILEIKDMNFVYWLMLFSVSCGANVVGLNISSAFSSAVTVYILIPLLLIPQMILSGAMFSFDKMNGVLKNKDKVPLVADIITSRWAFEAIAVEQFTSNQYEEKIFEQEQIEAIANYHLAYLFPLLEEKINYARDHFHHNESDSIHAKILADFVVIRNELTRQKPVAGDIDMSFIHDINEKKFNSESAEKAMSFLKYVWNIYNHVFLDATKEKDRILLAIDNSVPETKSLLQLKNEYFNESLSDLVRNVNSKHKIIEQDGYMIAKLDYIFFNPVGVDNIFDYRTHFFAPKKNCLGHMMNTYWFNCIVIWMITAVLFVMLYFDILRRVLEAGGRFFGKIAKTQS